MFNSPWTVIFIMSLFFVNCERTAFNFRETWSRPPPPPLPPSMMALLGWFEAFSVFKSVYLTEWLVSILPPIQFRFQGHIFHEGVDLIDTYPLFLVPNFFINGEIKQANVSHFSDLWACFEQLDWTTETSSGKHFWLDGSSFLSKTALLGLYRVFLKCYVLCALVVLVEAEIFDKHFMVLLATSKTKMKREQVPQDIKE